MIEKFTSHLKVDKKIVSLLSKSTYQKSFSSAIRELISNAYDADSLSVNIDYDSAFTYIEIVDDGNGMTKKEFEKYLTIAGTKQEEQFTRKYKRKRIGKFGVGFLSIFPFCETLEITTTAENSIDILSAKIPTKNYFDESRGLSDITIDEIPINGTISSNPKEKLRHYTKIRLVKPTHLVKQYFKKPVTRKHDSVLTWSPKDRFIWELQEDLPINLNETSKYHKKYQYDEPIGINVVVNGNDLSRNDYLEYVLDEKSLTFGNIQCKYIFTTNYKAIKPLEGRGIKIRVNNVGIGPRTDFQLKRDRGFSRLHWISGEVFFSEQIKEHLNIGRDGFISNGITDEIFEALAERLRFSANEVEAIAVAEKELINAGTSKAHAGKPRTEIIAANIKRLEGRGFKTVESMSDKIRIDKKQKIIYMPVSSADEQETIVVAGRKIIVEYGKWDFETDNSEPACKKLSRNKVLINQNYPLFKSKSVGNVFKRLHILLLFSEDQFRSSHQLYEYLSQQIIKEFREYIK